MIDRVWIPALQHALHALLNDDQHVGALRVVRNGEDLVQPRVAGGDHQPSGANRDRHNQRGVCRRPAEAGRYDYILGSSVASGFSRTFNPRYNQQQIDGGERDGGENVGAGVAAGPALQHRGRREQNETERDGEAASDEWQRGRSLQVLSRTAAFSQQIRPPKTSPARFPGSPVLRTGGLMKHRFGYLIAAALVFASRPHAVMSASPVRHSVPDVDILIDGAPQPRYTLDGRWYVEAHKGREYAIRLRNPYAVRVAVALSVDGLNTIDARETTAADARKWVLGPYESVTIGGWQTSQSEARRFEFTTEARSYGQALGKTANLGIISAAFFRERTPTIAPGTSNDSAARRPQAAPPSAPAEQESASAARRDKKAEDGYAATGMGRRTGHAVEQVWLELEDAPVQTVNIRYEYIRSSSGSASSRTLRGRSAAAPRGARGFEPGFSPGLPDRGPR